MPSTRQCSGITVAALPCLERDGALQSPVREWRTSTSAQSNPQRLCGSHSTNFEHSSGDIRCSTCLQALCGCGRGWERRRSCRAMRRRPMASVCTRRSRWRFPSSTACSWRWDRVSLILSLTLIPTLILTKYVNLDAHQRATIDSGQMPNVIGKAWTASGSASRSISCCPTVVCVHCCEVICSVLFHTKMLANMQAAQSASIAAGSSWPEALLAPFHMSRH